MRSPDQIGGTLILAADPPRDVAKRRFLRAVLRHGVLNHVGKNDTTFQGLTHVQAAELADVSRPSIHTFATSMRGAVLREDTLAIRPDVGYVLGVDFGRAHNVRVALSDIHGGVIDERPPRSEEKGAPLPYLTPFAALARAEKYIQELLEDNEHHGVTPEKLVGVGVSLPGPVKEGRAIGTDAGAWKLLDPADELQRRLPWGEDVPFVTANDAYLTALGESLWGTQSKHSIYIKWSSELRTALIVDGELYTGSSGMAGELPHTEIIADEAIPDDPKCKDCGRRGCLHRIADLEAIAALAGDKSYRATDIIERAQTTHPEAMERLQLAATSIGAAVLPLFTALNPEVVILGGALGSRAYPYVLESLSEAWQTKNPAQQIDVPIRGARRTRRTAAEGALAYVTLRLGPDYLYRRAVL